jgi:hypothetical protein
MKVPRLARIIGLLAFLAIVLFCFWYWEAENYSQSSMSGTYTFHSEKEKSILVLRADHTFQQELERDGNVKRASGSWRITGLGHISFSREFLMMSGEESCYEEPACGLVRNNFGFVSFALGLTPDEGPTFHKRLFR